jgi:hypothetical protein
MAMAYALGMRIPLVLVAALMLSLPAVEVQARAYDAKALARYDVSYVNCESQFPPMRGHGDEAYLNLWRIKLDDTARAQLAKVRSSAAYQAEKQRALRAAPKSASAMASSPISRECQGLWAEYQRTAQKKK